MLEKKIEIECLKDTKSFDMVINAGVVTKVEKWNSISSTTTTSTTGGGGRIYTNIWGEVTGSITPVNTTTTHSVNSKVNTRIFYGKSSYVTIENCDFITLEGNLLRVLFYRYNNTDYIAAVKDTNTGFYYQFMNNGHFINKIMGLKFSTVQRAINIGIVWIIALSLILIFLLRTLAFPAQLVPVVITIALVTLLGPLMGINTALKKDKRKIISKTAFYKALAEIVQAGRQLLGNNNQKVKKQTIKSASKAASS